MKKEITVAASLLVGFMCPGQVGAFDIDAFIKEVKSKVVVERMYTPGTTTEITLKPDQTALLKFKDNPGEIAEFMCYFYDDSSKVFIFLRCTDERFGSSNKILTRDLPKDIRGMTKSGSEYLWIFSEWEPKDGRAIVSFRTSMSVTDEELAEAKAIGKAWWEARSREKIKEVEAVVPLEWDSKKKRIPTILMTDPDEPRMVRLREQYKLEEVIQGAATDFEKLKHIVQWVQKQWQHNGSNTPSRSDPLTILEEASEGKRFRCVEYARVVAACAQALGMPSRVLALKRSDVETAESGAGHVVAEVWLDQYNKWVVVDGQWAAIPEKDGTPLNAVELQQAIADDPSKLTIYFATENNKNNYLSWVVPYLYYFDFGLDQRFYTQKHRSSSKGQLMLVPKGANKPKVFQIKHPINNCTYISNPEIFYPSMKKNGQ